MRFLYGTSVRASILISIDTRPYVNNISQHMQVNLGRYLVQKKVFLMENEVFKGNYDETLIKNKL